MLTSVQTRYTPHTGGAAHRVIVLANRAPFRHEVGPDGRVGTVRSASGLVTALEPLLEERGRSLGRHGATSTTGDSVDSTPRGASRYRVRWVAIDEQEYRGFYQGFANEGLWPLCHAVGVEPFFRPADYAAYRAANHRFVDAVVQEAGGETPIVLVQDYHFALAPRMLRQRLPASRLVSFWHIPWPDAETFARCPWASELLYGLLGSDTVGFQTPEDGTRFLESVEALTGASVNRLSSTVRLAGRSTSVRAHPVGVAWRHTVARGTPSVADCRTEVFRSLGLEADTRLVVGVDRLDYTKGINEKLLAVEQVLEAEPAVPGKAGAGAGGRALTRGAPGVLGAPRSGHRYGATHQRAVGSGSYRPIVLLDRHHTQDEVYTLYRAADVCYVGSLRDGMNLVAKEFVCARDRRARRVAPEPLHRRRATTARRGVDRSLQPTSIRRRPVASVADAGGGADAPYARAEGDRRGVRRGLVGAADDP